MLESPDDRLIRIGVFYDADDLTDAGHDPAAGVSIQPLHRLFRRTVAQAEQSDERRSQIVDAHWFHRAAAAGEGQADAGDLAGTLANAGVVTHPVPSDGDGTQDRLPVSLALECFELAIHKRYSVVALVAAKPAYLPLVRKLNTLGTRVLVVDVQPAGAEDGEPPRPGKLVDEATYAMPLRSLTEVPAGRAPAPPQHPRETAPSRPHAPARPEGHRPDSGPEGHRPDSGPPAPPRSEEKAPRPPKPTEPPSEPVDETVERVGQVARVVLPKGFGFLRDDEGREWFFHRSGVAAPGFEALNARDTVKFRGRNMPKGLEAFWVSPQTAAERAKSQADAAPEMELEPPAEPPAPSADARPPASEPGEAASPAPQPGLTSEQGESAPPAPEPDSSAEHVDAAVSAPEPLPEHDATVSAPEPEHVDTSAAREPEITPDLEAPRHEPEPGSTESTGPSPDVPAESATFGEAPPAGDVPNEHGEPVAADGPPSGDPDRSPLE